MKYQFYILFLPRQSLCSGANPHARTLEDIQSMVEEIETRPPSRQKGLLSFEYWGRAGACQLHQLHARKSYCKQEERKTIQFKSIQRQQKKPREFGIIALIKIMISLEISSRESFDDSFFRVKQGDFCLQQYAGQLG